jgi:hypothetical protein
MTPDVARAANSPSEKKEEKGFWERTGVIATAITAICAAIGGVVAAVHFLLPNSSASTADYQHQVVGFCNNMHALGQSYNGAAIDQANGNYIRAQVVSDMNDAVKSGQALVASLASIAPPSSLASERTAALQAWNAEARATTAFAQYVQSHLPSEFTQQQLQAAETTDFPNARLLISNVNAAFTALAGQTCQPMPG